MMTIKVMKFVFLFFSCLPLLAFSQASFTTNEVERNTNNILIQPKYDSVSVLRNPLNGWVMYASRSAHESYWDTEYFVPELNSELENVALRSQMNPHFLFNSLSAIKFFILSNQNSQAANYLNRFSKLIRLILEHSKESLIDLNDELKALKLYLEIESTRFDDSFSYHIHIDEDVNSDTLLVPPLLLQPFVENAIWHGLLPKKNEEKLLKISVLKRKEDYLFVIEDNGIGRASANKKKSNDKKLHRSFGMQITQERIDLYNNNTQGNIKLKIIDLPANSGTRIEITYRL